MSESYTNQEIHDAFEDKMRAKMDATFIAGTPYFAKGPDNRYRRRDIQHDFICFRAGYLAALGRTPPP